MNKKTKNNILNPLNSNGIYLYEYPVINGIRQYVQIRGTNKNNPLLLFVHGGPGGSMAGLTHILHKGWEERYTVVNWDQRNTCKTYFANKDKAEDISQTGSIDDYVNDIDGVISYLHTVCDFDKLILMGFSWGSVISAEYAKRHPENLMCYVGVGQFVNYKEGLNVTCSRMIKIAEKDQKHNDIIKIQKIVSSIPQKPEMTKAFMGQIRICAVLASRYISKNVRPFPVKELLSSPFLNLSQKLSMMKSDISLFKTTFVTVMTYDLRQNVNFKIPVLFVYGDEDFSCPPQLLKGCYDDISAPSKKFVEIPKASHSCFYDNPDEFMKVLTEFLDGLKIC